MFKMKRSFYQEKLKRQENKRKQFSTAHSQYVITFIPMNYMHIVTIIHIINHIKFSRNVDLEIKSLTTIVYNSLHQHLYDRFIFQQLNRTTSGNFQNIRHKKLAFPCCLTMSRHFPYLATDTLYGHFLDVSIEMEMGASHNETNVSFSFL